jgi:uncharacterized membrane protein
MKYAFVAFLILPLLGCSNIEITKGEQCTGGGAIAGAVIAGPVGALVGAVGGHQACKK